MTPLRQLYTGLKKLPSGDGVLTRAILVQFLHVSSRAHIYFYISKWRARDRRGKPYSLTFLGSPQGILFQPRMDRAEKAPDPKRAWRGFDWRTAMPTCPLFPGVRRPTVMPTQQATPGPTRPSLPAPSTCTTLALDPSTGQMPDQTKQAPRVCSPVVPLPR